MLVCSGKKMTTMTGMTTMTAMTAMTTVMLMTTMTKAMSVSRSYVTKVFCTRRLCFISRQRMGLIFRSQDVDTVCTSSKQQ